MAAPSTVPAAPSRGKRVAVIGCGAAGLGAAYVLGQAGDVVTEIVLYEQREVLGGHANTVDVAGEPVDTGFLVCNEGSYPNLLGLFEELGIPTQPTDMSFAVSLGGRSFEWSSSTLGGLFGTRANATNPSFYGMLRDMLRFNREAPAFLKRCKERPEDPATHVSMDEYLRSQGYGDAFKNWYLIPQMAAVWSASSADVLAFPARTFIQFSVNHSLLQVLDRPQWRTVSRRSREYVRRIAASLPPAKTTIRLSTPVTSIRRVPVPVGGSAGAGAAGGAGAMPSVSGAASAASSSGWEVIVTDATGASQTFDAVIMGCHPDESLATLGADATPTEREVLGAFKYQPNVAYLHTDPRLMPSKRELYSAWNYIGKGASGGAGVALDPADAEPCCVSYWLNQLQALPAHLPDLFVTLNPSPDLLPAPGSVVQELHYSHPQYSLASVAAQGRVAAELQGSRGVFYAGAWLGYGFHEDAMTSGLRAAFKVTGSKPAWWNRAIHTPARVLAPSMPLPKAALAAGASAEAIEADRADRLAELLALRASGAPYWQDNLGNGGPVGRVTASIKAALGRLQADGAGAASAATEGAGGSRRRGAAAALGGSDSSGAAAAGAAGLQPLGSSADGDVAGRVVLYPSDAIHAYKALLGLEAAQGPASTGAGAADAAGGVTLRAPRVAAEVAASLSAACAGGAHRVGGAAAWLPVSGPASPSHESDASDAHSGGSTGPGSSGAATETDSGAGSDAEGSAGASLPESSHSTTASGTGSAFSPRGVIRAAQAASAVAASGGALPDRGSELSLATAAAPDTKGNGKGKGSKLQMVTLEAITGTKAAALTAAAACTPVSPDELLASLLARRAFKSDAVQSVLADAARATAAAATSGSASGAYPAGTHPAILAAAAKYTLGARMESGQGGYTAQETPLHAPDVHPSAWSALWSSVKSTALSLAARPVLAFLHGAISTGCLLLRTPDGYERVFGDASAKAPLRARIAVHSWMFFARVAAEADIGLARSFIAGEWTTDDLCGVFHVFIANRDRGVNDAAAVAAAAAIAKPAVAGASAATGATGGARAAVSSTALRAGKLWTSWLGQSANYLAFRLGMDNSLAGSRKNISAHYDLSNDLFASFLDPVTMMYSCAIFEARPRFLREVELVATGAEAPVPIGSAPAATSPAAVPLAKAAATKASAAAAAAAGRLDLQRTLAATVSSVPLPLPITAASGGIAGGGASGAHPAAAPAPGAAPATAPRAPPVTDRSAAPLRQELVFSGSLEAAQLRKLDHLIARANVQPHNTVLDLGFGWGGLSIRLAETVGCRVHGITLSKEQLELASERVAARGLSHLVTFELVDYRELAAKRPGAFDRIISVEMVEAVGFNYFGAYMAALDALLAPNGVVVLQAITLPESRYDEYVGSADMINTFIFPGGCCPSVTALMTAAAKTRLSLASTEDFGLHYAETLRRWRANMNVAADAVVRPLGFDDAFLRTFNYYFCYCEAGFASQTLGLHILTFARPGTTALWAGKPAGCLAQPMGAPLNDEATAVVVPAGVF